MLNPVTTTNTLPPHLVPLPKGEETLAHLSSNFSVHSVGSPTLTSPIGRGSRQRGEGMGCHWIRNLGGIH